MTGIPSILDVTVGFQVNRLATLIRRQLARALRPYGLNAERWQILAAVVEAHPEHLSQSDIARLVLKDRYAVSRMIDKMVADGWIERQSDPVHGRIQRIAATPEAMDRFDDVRAALVAGFADLRTALSASDRRELMRITSQLIAVLDQ